MEALSLVFFVLSIVLMGVVNYRVSLEEDDEVLGLCSIAVFAAALVATILHACAINNFDIIVGLGIVACIASAASIFVSSNAAMNYDCNKDPYLIVVTIFYVLTFIEICLVAVSLGQ